MLRFFPAAIFFVLLLILKNSCTYLEQHVTTNTGVKVYAFNLSHTKITSINLLFTEGSILNEPSEKPGVAELSAAIISRKLQGLKSGFGAVARAWASTAGIHIQILAVKPGVLFFEELDRILNTLRSPAGDISETELVRLKIQNEEDESGETEKKARALIGNVINSDCAKPLVSGYDAIKHEDISVFLGKAINNTNVVAAVSGNLGNASAVYSLKKTIEKLNPPYDENDDKPAARTFITLKPFTMYIHGKNKISPPFYALCLNDKNIDLTKAKMIMQNHDAFKVTATDLVLYCISTRAPAKDIYGEIKKAVDSVLTNIKKRNYRKNFYVDHGHYSLAMNFIVNRAAGNNIPLASFSDNNGKIPAYTDRKPDMLVFISQNNKNINPETLSRDPSLESFRIEDICKEQ